MSYNQQRTIQTSNQPTTAFFPDDYPKFDGSQHCAQGSGDDFFPEQGAEAATVRVLKRICRGCPFIAPCGMWALDHDEAGYWAGMSERERKKITVWSVDNSPDRHGHNPMRWFTGDWREGLDRALQTGRVVSVGASPPCTKNTAGTRALDRSRYDNDPDLEHVREVLIETGLPYIIENVESEVTRRKMRGPLRLCGSEFNLQADDPATGLRLWLKRHRLFESNLPLLGAGGCRHPKGLRCAGVYGGARRDEVEARTVRRGGYVPKDVEVLRRLLGAPEWMTEQGMFLSIPPAYTRHLGEQLLSLLKVAA